MFNTCDVVNAKTIHVGGNNPIKKIQEAISIAKPNDSILVEKGIYKEGNVLIDKKVYLLGIGKPIVDGQKKYEVVSIKADSVVFDGFIVQHSGIATLDDPGGIKVYNSRGVIIQNNTLEDNFFGIYIQFGKNCIVRNNHVKAYGLEEQQIGNGIHCWKSDSLQIIGNTISGHRDGIYFEFVTNSVIWRNISTKNIRYGLHFMFSNNDAYITNVLKNNGAGVAVMFSKKVSMLNNFFEDNWGDAAYGILLKEISDGYIIGNHFSRNTAALYLEGASRLVIQKNTFEGNGWAMKVQASCIDNVFEHNNFFHNTFDASTNGCLVLNTFNHNYWDKYEGYDLNKDGIGDIPFHPLSLFAVLVEKNPPTMLLFRSFMVGLLDKSERMLPSLTPDNFKDPHPRMHPLKL
jgi:nitrous oxidase accessory protein